VRYAPEQHLTAGLTLPQVVEAVQAGFAEGSAEAARAGNPIRMGTLLTAMRHAARSMEIAELAIAYRDHGVVGFDIAGAEAGYPPTRHLDAFEYLQRENYHFTIHAGEAFGLPSAEVLNVNIPGKGERRYQWTKLGKRRYADDVTERADPWGRPYFWIGGGSTGHDDLPGSDCNAVHEGVVSITPLDLGRDHHARIAEPPFAVAGYDSVA
jgi:hypothetical protein